MTEYKTLKEQQDAIAANEQALAEQWKPYRDSAVNVNLTGKPAETIELINNPSPGVVP